MSGTMGTYECLGNHETTATSSDMSVLTADDVILYSRYYELLKRPQLKWILPVQYPVWFGIFLKEK